MGGWICIVSVFVMSCIFGFAYGGVGLVVLSRHVYSLWIGVCW
jgi:hypothetical protein